MSYNLHICIFCTFILFGYSSGTSTVVTKYTKSNSSSRYVNYAAKAVNCTFDVSPCSWKNAFAWRKLDDFNWKIGKGVGKQRGSGTKFDHTGGGKYAFIRATKGKGNRTALFISKTFRVDRPMCLQFWYYMKGATIGHLAVLSHRGNLDGKNSSTAEWDTIWNLRGRQGAAWKLAKVELTTLQVTTIAFEGFDWERGKSGNILLDDVSIAVTSRESPCAITPSFADPKYNGDIVQNGTAVTNNTSPSTIKSNPLTSTTQQKTTSPTPASKITVAGTEKKIATTKKIKTNKINNNNSDTNNVAALGSTKTLSSGTSLHILIGGTVIAVCVIVVALALFARRQRRRHHQPPSMYDDTMSVTMARIYSDDVNQIDTSVDYRKFNNDQ